MLCMLNSEAIFFLKYFQSTLVESLDENHSCGWMNVAV